MFGIEYRPLTFKEIIGLEVIKRILISNLKYKKFAQGYIFEGSYSTGKTTISRVFARSILCQNPQEDFSPCNTCYSCKLFLENRHPNYFEIDAANNGTKDKVQEIREMLRFDSIVGNSKRIILFDEAHNISKEGKDALLLQLEKKDENVILIFCTTESNKMPETIKSRCYVFKLPEPTEKDILKKLKFICRSRSIEYEEDALYKIVLSSGRHYRDAENKLAMASAISNKITKDIVKDIISIYDEEIVNLLLNLSDNLSGIIEEIERIISKMTIKDIYESIVRILSDAIKVSKGFVLVSNDYMSLIKKIVDKYDMILYDLLDYFLKKRFLEPIFFQSSILLLHNKIVSGEFSKVRYDSNSRDIKVNNIEKKENNKELEDKEILSILLDGNMEPWKRDSLLREYKKKKEQFKKEEVIEEKVSKFWKTDYNLKAKEMVKEEIDVDKFKQIIGGGNGNKFL